MKKSVLTFFCLTKINFMEVEKDRSGPIGTSLVKMHPAKDALFFLRDANLARVTSCVDCSVMDCPGGRCIELGDEVKSAVAEHLGVEAVNCFDNCPNPQEPCMGKACLGKRKEQ